jgi:UDP-glucose:(heptosyl)LPS alpha-1,3-glucosyltransferase
MKIALVRSRYNPYGGAERFVANALSALQSQNLQLTIVTRSWQEQPGVAALIVNPFYLGNVWRDWGFARGVSRAISKEKFDLVQSHERLACCDVYRAGDGVHREWLTQRKRTKDFWGRLSISLNPYHHYMLLAERKLFLSSRLKAVICNSEMVKKEIQYHFGLPASKCHVIYSGVDSTRFSPGLREAHLETFRAEHNISVDSLVYLFVGSGFERKGVSQFLRALSKLPANCEGVIVGADKHLPRYEQEAIALGLTGRVCFTGGLKDVGSAYGAADVFVSPTLYDPFPNAALEAMASGLPIITSTKSGVAELIQDGINGYRCDALDVETLANQMMAVRDDKRRQEMGDAARRTVLPLSFEIMSAKLVDLYKKLLALN